MNIAILVAGGSGRRFGGKTPKQFITLAGRPMVAWPLLRLAGSPRIGRVVLVLPENQRARGMKLVAALPPRLRKKIITAAGGKERADSVLCGLAHCGAEDIAFVHDAARPLLSVRDLNAILAAGKRGPAVLGRPVTSTIKKITDGQISATVNREELFIAETPQAIPAALLRRALLMAKEKKILVTDDAAYLERLGLTLTPVTARDPNFKITARADLLLADRLLANR